ncbi:hypothetical protein [Planktotalea sp.]|uniref:hypothetical protein n=1 Tax=Planktotalea sp. TaxID=2029877 RepID=UPI003D6A9E0B
MKELSVLVAKLERHLESEYRGLLKGDINMIERMGVEKIEMLEEIGSTSLRNIEKFYPLRSKLARNQMLSYSAIEGMRAAITRAKDINDVSCNLRTYEPSGKKSMVAVKSERSLFKRS